MGTVLVVDVRVNRSDKLQQFIFVAGANCAENRPFSQAQFRSTLRAQCLVRQWIHVLRQFLGAFERARTRQGGTSDPEVDFVPLSGCGTEKCAQSMLRSIARGN